MRFSVVCALIIGLLLTTAGMAVGAEPIKIGAFLSATGPGAYLGDPEVKTLKLEVEKVNRKGGVLGRPLQLFLYDDGSETKQAVSLVRKLIDQDKVDVILGGTLTGTTLAVAPLVDDAHVPFISLAGATAIIEPVKKWMFKSAHTDRMAVDKNFQDMKKRGFSKIAILGGSTGFDESCRKEAKGLAAKYNFTVVADETYSGSDTDMTPQLTNIRSHKDVQAVMQCGAGAPTVVTVRNYHRLGMSNIPLYFTHAIGSHEFLQSVGEAGEGVRLAAPALLIAEQLPDKDPQKKPAMAYAKEYGAAYHEPISIFGAHAIDAFTIYLAAVKKAGTADRGKVRDAIEQLKNVVGVAGVFSMAPTDHLGLTPEAFHMVEIRNGKWKLLY